MTKSTKRILFIGGTVVAAAALVPTGLWFSITHRPAFYAELVATPDPARAEEAKHFEAQTLQLRNDIVNEPAWEAVFSDKEVNAWLAEDLVKHFADQLPPEIKDPRILFEPDRLTLGFTFNQGSVETVVWVIARVAVPEDNALSVTFEKVRAGALPIPSSKFIEPLSRAAKAQGLDLEWSHEDGLPVALLKYRSEKGTKPVTLERVQLGKGQIRLSGRSARDAVPVASPDEARRRLLQRDGGSNSKSQPASDVARSEANPAK